MGIEFDTGTTGKGAVNAFLSLFLGELMAVREGNGSVWLPVPASGNWASQGESSGIE